MVRFKLLCIIGSLLILSGCKVGMKTMNAGEYGVVFSALPRIFGGGVRPKTVQPGEWEIVLPWETLHVVDTSLQRIGWGAVGEGSSTEVADYVETRTVDGNEVGIAIEVLYRVLPEKVTHVVQRVGLDKSKIAHLVAAVARADIRSHLNILTTSDFFTQERRDVAVQLVRKAMEARLLPEGIAIERVVFRDYKFERAGEEGAPPDSSYQQQIDETQTKIQETEQEEKRRAAQLEEKGRELAVIDGEKKSMVAMAKGISRQAKVRGDSYLEQKKNEAAQIRTSGTNEVEAMKKRIAALSGPGGEALLRLEIAKSLAAKKPKFVLMNSAGAGKGGGVELNKVDTNELLRQAGIFTALADGVTEKKPAAGSLASEVTEPQLPASELKANNPVRLDLPK